MDNSDSIKESLNQRFLEFDCLAVSFYSTLALDHQFPKVDLVAMNYVRNLANCCLYQINFKQRIEAVKGCLVMIQEATTILNRFADSSPGADYIFTALNLNTRLNRITAILFKYREVFDESPEITECIDHLERMAKIETNSDE